MQYWINNREGIHWQRLFYLQYFRSHGLKAQVVILPGGMIGGVFFTAL